MQIYIRFCWLACPKDAIHLYDSFICWHDLRGVEEEQIFCLNDARIVFARSAASPMNGWERIPHTLEITQSCSVRETQSADMTFQEHTHTDTHTHTRTHTHTHAHTRTHTHTHAHARTHTHMHARTHTHTQHTHECVIIFESEASNVQRSLASVIGFWLARRRDWGSCVGLCGSLCGFSVRGPR